MDMTLIPSPISRRLSLGLASALLLALPAAAQPVTPAPSPAPIRCEADSCRNDDGLLLRIRDDSEPELPLPGRTDLPAANVVPLAPAVTPDVASRGGQFMAELPNGGVVWATEDPTMVPPSLSVQAAATVPFENGRVIRPLRFHSYNNYASFIQKLEVTLYRGTDTDLVTPLARIELPADYVGDAEWSGELPPQIKLRTGDELIYVARAYGAGGAFDAIGCGCVCHKGSYHHRSGRATKPARSSIARPALSTACSSSGLPMICRPSGRPLASSPAGTDIAGRPARLAGTVKTSFRYIATGSSCFSSSPKAAEGVAGVSSASHVSQARSKSRLISVRTFCAFT